MSIALVTAFIAGMAVTVVELSATRLLAPYFGASLFVWTNVIGVILFGLALGYFAGGRLADRTTNPRLLFRIIGIAGLFVLATPFLVKAVARFATVEGIFMRTVPLVLIVASFLATAFLFLIPVLLLGMTSPFLIRMVGRAHPETIGRVSGRIFGWSTVGSILGVFTTGIVFIPFFGTRATLVGSAVILLALAAFGEVRWRASIIVLLLFVAGGALFGNFGPLAARSSTLLFEKESPYQYIRVEEVEGSRYLIFNEGNGAQSVWRRDTLATGFYYDYLASLPLFFPTDQSLRILLVGLGGGTIPKQYAALYTDRSYSIDAVEIDPVVVDVARQWFDLPEEHVRIHVADGRTFLARASEQYDLIILDAYAQQYYIPWHMTTQEFFTLVQSRLAPHGLVAFNVAAARSSSQLLTSIVRTVQGVFPFVATTPMPDSWNQIVFARDAPIDFNVLATANDLFLREKGSYLALHTIPAREATDARIFTDDRAPVELLTDALFLTEAL